MMSKLIVKIMGLPAIALGLGLYSTISQAAIIASYDASVDVSITSTFEFNSIETELYDSQIEFSSYAIGTAVGNGTSAASTVVANAVTSVGASASGSLLGNPSSTTNFWLLDTYFTIENNTTSDMTGQVDFAISWATSIFNFTDSSEALAGMVLYIEDSYENVVFDKFVELNSKSKGVGDFNASDALNISLKDLSIAAGEFEEFYLQVDAYGYAEVSEPSGIVLAGLALLLAIRQRQLG